VGIFVEEQLACPGARNPFAGVTPYQQTTEHVTPLLSVHTFARVLDWHRDIPLPDGCGTFEDLFLIAFDEIRFCGAKSMQVMRRMKALTSDLIAALPKERHAPLRH
jgi:hypothetical protein